MYIYKSKYNILTLEVNSRQRLEIHVQQPHVRVCYQHYPGYSNLEQMHVSEKFRTLNLSGEISLKKFYIN